MPPVKPNPPTVPAPAAAPPESRWRMIGRRLGLVALGAAVMFVVAVFLLPMWISNEQGRTYILDRINRKLNGPRIAIDSWSIGWFRATDVRKLRIVGPDGR